MREDAFRAFLKACDYTDNSVASRLARCRSVEKHLRVELDTLDLTPIGLRMIQERLVALGRADAVLASEMNAVRTYRRFVTGEPPAPRTSATARPTALRSQRQRPSVVSDATVPDLMGLYADILAELKSRAIIRTANSPVGDYAELLFCRAFGWERAGASEKAFDARDRANNRRYQVKARRLAEGRTTAQLGVLRDLPIAAFDELAVLLFDERMAVFRAALIPFEVVIDAAADAPRVNGHRIVMTEALWRRSGIIDVTARLQTTAAAL